MNTLHSLRKLALVALSIVAPHTLAQTFSATDIERCLGRAKTQAIHLAQQLENQNDALPRTFEKDKLITCRYNNWVSGFFPGVLWMLYEETADTTLLHYAQLFTHRVEPAKKMTSTHDLGFMLLNSFGHAYRITHNPHYQDVILEGTANLATRFSPKMGVMESWNRNDKWQYPVIIDNMMNLEMLVYASRTSANPLYEQMAHTHAHTTIRNHFRPNYSTFHVVSYDTITAQPHAKQTAQGYADHSAWARGQAWGLYGYTMMYRETHRPEYLEQALHIAHFLINHPNLPADKVPYWDYNAPRIPNEPRDASAAAIMASAFIELSTLDPTPNAAQWLNIATQQLHTLSTPQYMAEENTNGGFLLKHSVGSLPANSEIDTPQSYADYYFIEALLRLKKHLFDSKNRLKGEPQQ